MSEALRTYRILPVLLALLLLLSGASPLVMHLCVEEMQAAPSRGAHACCNGHTGCPDHVPTLRVPAEEVCCVVAPVGDGQEVAVAAPSVSRPDAGFVFTLTPLWQEAAREVRLGVSLSDKGPPRLPVRPHLANVVLLI